MEGKIIFLKNQLATLGGDTMSKIEREKMIEIEKRVREITKELDFEKSLSVDIVSLVKKDGFQVKTKMMPIETTGVLLVNDNAERNKRIIIVNKQFTNPDNEDDVIFKKSRFITAHEYGHFLLHKSADKSLYAHRDSDKREEALELEADYFARSLLMPLPYFKTCVDILSEMAIDDKEFSVAMLSKLFKVTRKKVRSRMEDLHTLQPMDKVVQ